MPTVLLVTATLYRHGVARLPHALRQAGFRVWLVCPRVSAVRYSDHIDGGVAYPDGIGPLGLARVIADSVEESGADLLLFADELSVSVARSLLAGLADGIVSPRLRTLLQTWVGGVHACAFQRSAMVERVQTLGIRTPRQVILGPETEAAALAGLGTPILVKQDHSSGGGGVTPAPTPHAAIGIASDLRLQDVGPNARGSIVAQEFIAGTDASVAFAAFGGRMLGAFAYKTLRRYPEPFGPASVIEALARPDLLDLARRVVADVAYTGFGGIDVILPEDGGPPVFLELNTRPPQTAHLGSLFGADLFRAMARELGVEPVAPASAPAATTVALFPAEWIRDPRSPHLHTAHHDVPWNEPRMAAAVVTLTPRVR